MICKSILRGIHPMKELTEVTLTDLWKEYNQSFRDFWEMQDTAVKEFRKRFIEESLGQCRTLQCHVSASKKAEMLGA
jgi:hypothetical protein